MSILVAALVVILLVLSWKYILRLEPAGVFAAMWIFLFAMILLLQDYFQLRFLGMLYIAGCIITFVVGTIFCDTLYQPTAEKVSLTFKSDRAMPVILALFAGAMINPLYSIVLHGFSLQALLSMQDLLNMNKGISEIRYAGSEAHDTVNQIFLILCYAAPLFGGFCYRWVGRLTKAICVMTLIPGMIIALTQSMKMVMITGFILWFTGFILCLYSYGYTVRIKLKGMLYALLIIPGFFGILFISMVFRTGEVSEKTILDISQKFFTYALGHFHCFDLWYTTYEPAAYSWGTKTFMGISNLLGLEERSQGIYAEYMQVGKNGYYGISNVFTCFRPLIEDFGEAGTYVIMFAMGVVSKMSFKNLLCRKHVFLNQTLTSAVYAYLFWSFAASFYAYTSYLATFFVAYFLFLFLQKETAHAETD